MGLGSVRVGCCHGFGFREGGGGVDLVAVRYGCRCGCGCQCGCELLGWVWEGMGSAGGDGYGDRKMVLIKKSFS